MTVWRKSVTGLTLGVALATAWFVGNNFVRNTEFARAQEQVDASRAQLQALQDMSAGYKAVGKAVEPSVVNIDVKKTVRNMSGNLRKFFIPPNSDDNANPQDMPPGFDSPDDQEEMYGTGSGVIVAAEGNVGYIVTNNHVAGGTSEMDVTLWDGREIKNAKLVATDPKSDIAVVKIEADHLIPAKWGDSDTLEKGDIVMAFGSPFGYVGSMTHGIVSAIHRSDIGIINSAYRYENFIQTDAPINPGNSGGPLVNLKGEVIGINTAIATRSGGFQGIGFAIPSNQAKVIYEALKTKGKVVRGWLGVKIGNVTQDPDKAAALGYTGANGVLVDTVFRNTPGTGKLRPGDIITAIDGKEIDKVDELRNTIANETPGTEIKLTVFRDQKNQDVTIKVGEQPDDPSLVAQNSEDNAEPKTTSSETLGMRLGDVTADFAKEYDLDAATKGVAVEGIRPNSLAMRGGLHVGDVITQVNGTEVNSATEFNAAIAKGDLTKGIKLNVTDREGNRLIFVKSTDQ